MSEYSVPVSNAFGALELRWQRRRNILGRVGLEVENRSDKEVEDLVVTALGPDFVGVRMLGSPLLVLPARHRETLFFEPEPGKKGRLIFRVSYRDKDAGILAGDVEIERG
jgi:hypothetical protein